MSVRIQIGARVQMNPETVDRAIMMDDDYAGTGIVEKDDKSDLPYLVRFEGSGCGRWFTREELLEVFNEYRLLFTNNRLDKDGDAVGKTVITAGAHNPFNIKPVVMGKELNGYNNAKTALTANHLRVNMHDVSEFRFVYALIDGMIVEIPFFQFRVEVNTIQHEIGAVYCLESAVNSRFINGTIVTLVEQEPEGYVGLSYLVKRVNSEERDWIGHDSVLVRL